MLLPPPSSRFLLSVLSILICLDVSISQILTGRTSAIFGAKGFGTARINPEPKPNIERGNQGLSKSFRHIDDDDGSKENVLDNSIMPRTRSRMRSRMSKSDPPQVQTDALEQEEEQTLQLEDVDLVAEESVSDPIFYKDLPPRRPEYSTLFLPATTTATTSGATSFVHEGLVSGTLQQNEVIQQHREVRSAEASPQNLPFDPARAKRHRQPARPNTNTAPQHQPEVSLPESGPRGQPQADRRFFHSEHAANSATNQHNIVINAPEEFPTFSPSTPSPPPIYYDFQPSSNSPSTVKTVDSTIYHDSLALPETFNPTFALPPVTSHPTSQRYQSYPATPILNNGPAQTPSVTTIRNVYQAETFRPGQVLTEKIQSTSFGVPPVLVDTNSNYQASKKNKGPTSGYYPPIARVMPRVDHMEAECSDDVMKLRVKFNATFSGLIYSAGYSYDTDCIYINGTGTDEYEFFIQLNRCGTLGGSDHNKKRDANQKNTDPTKNYMWNTVTIQYNPLIEEEWDEHFKVTCEYGYDFWKTVTFPFLDVEVNTADPVHFTLTPPECHMEIRNGYGTTGTKVTGPVHVGDPITLLILMRSQWDGFDIVVNDCFAHNGANKKIQLIDHHGCPVDDKLISKFQGTWGMANTMYETLIYAHMKTFRFTGTPALYIECDIRMCHGRCPTQSCNWRSSKAVPSARRKRRNAADQVEGADDDIDDIEEGEISTDPQALAMSSFNESLSDSINLFQAIHVLQSKEDEMALKKNDSSSEPLVTGQNTICVESMVLAAIIGSLSMVALLSSVIVTFLCLRLRKHKSSDNSDTLDAGGAQHVRSSLGFGSGKISRQSENAYVLGGTSSDMNMIRTRLKSEYVHSAQARIP